MSCRLHGLKNRLTGLRMLLLAAAVFNAAEFVPQAARAEERLFRLALAEGTPRQAPPTFQARQGDVIFIEIESDQALEVHLHGYDSETTVAAGQAASLRFEALYSGRYPAEAHGASLQGPLFYLEVLP